MEGVLPWTEEEEVVGEAVVLKTFHLTGARAADVGGCRVKVGRLLRSATYRLIRDGKVRSHCQLPLLIAMECVSPGDPRGPRVSHEDREIRCE